MALDLADDGEAVYVSAAGTGHGGAKVQNVLRDFVGVVLVFRRLGGFCNF